MNGWRLLIVAASAAAALAVGLGAPAGARQPGAMVEANAGAAQPVS